MPKMPLTLRDWTCPHGGAHHDRDVNAANQFANNGREFNGRMPIRVCLTAALFGDSLGQRPAADDRSL